MTTTTFKSKRQRNSAFPRDEYRSDSRLLRICNAKTPQQHHQLCKHPPPKMDQPPQNATTARQFKTQCSLQWIQVWISLRQIKTTDPWNMSTIATIRCNNQSMMMMEAYSKIWPRNDLVHNLPSSAPARSSPHQSKSSTRRNCRLMLKRASMSRCRLLIEWCWTIATKTSLHSGRWWPSTSCSTRDCRHPTKKRGRYRMQQVWSKTALDSLWVLILPAHFSCLINKNGSSKKAKTGIREATRKKDASKCILSRQPRSE